MNLISLLLNLVATTTSPVPIPLLPFFDDGNGMGGTNVYYPYDNITAWTVNPAPTVDTLSVAKGGSNTWPVAWTDYDRWWYAIPIAPYIGLISQGNAAGSVNNVFVAYSGTPGTVTTSTDTAFNVSSVGGQTITITVSSGYNGDSSFTITYDVIDNATGVLKDSTVNRSGSVKVTG